MSFTQVTITHVFTNADSTPGSGAITFTLEKRMTNGSQTVLPSKLTANLSSSGALSQVLYANDDTNTVPSDAQWRVDLELQGDEAATYFITVPHGQGATVDLGSLLPQQASGG